MFCGIMNGVYFGYLVFVVLIKCVCGGVWEQICFGANFFDSFDSEKLFDALFGKVNLL